MMATRFPETKKRLGKIFSRSLTLPISNSNNSPTLQRKLSQIHSEVTGGKNKAFSLSDVPAYVDALKGLGGEPIDDRLFFLEKVLTLVSRLPPSSTFAKSVEAVLIDVLYKDLPHPPSNFLSPIRAFSVQNTTLPYYFARSADGSNYNPLLPELGRASTPYARTVPSAFTTSLQSLPDPGIVFDMLLKRTPKTTGSTTKSGTSLRTSGFVPHPGGISSLFFAFADLIIHSCFNTSHANSSINNASSYLDLSPLYGSSEKDVERVRRTDGTGRLWDDVFADPRILFMPPPVAALLVLFCRNHNYIAEKLLAINERGTFKDPTTLEGDASKAQDDEIFAKARLINCGFFTQVILRDYVGAILGLVRDGSTWRLDPLSPSRHIDHVISPRGQGNAVSIEFNLLYRWHACLSESDTKWTEDVFSELFDGKAPSEITVKDFKETLATKLRPDPDVRTWQFDGISGYKLERDEETKRFKDDELAAVLQSATASPAGAFKARGVPEVLKVVEILAIEASRNWGSCSMNEFRKFFGLKEYMSFAEWNPDPAVHVPAEALYRDINNLELYIGLQAEATKPPMPGSGLCPGFTMSRAILADAVALVRGDPYLTTEYTTQNLTSWGFNSTQVSLEDGSFGGMINRLLFRTLPDYYPANNVYSHFPFLVPAKAKEFMGVLDNSPIDLYEFSRPVVPAPALVLTEYEDVGKVISKPTIFTGEWSERIADIFGSSGLDVDMIDKAITSQDVLKRYKVLLAGVTTKLIKQRALDVPGKEEKYVDIVADVANIVPVWFIANHLSGLSYKTKSSPENKYSDKELYAMFAKVSNFVYLNYDPATSWTLRARSLEVANVITNTLEEHLVKHRAEGARQSSSSNGPVHFVLDFLKPLLDTWRGTHPELARDIFSSVVPTAALYSKALAIAIDSCIDDEGFRNTIKDGDDAAVMRYVDEALRLHPLIPGVVRTSTFSGPIGGNLVKRGQRVYCNIGAANQDPSIYGPECDQATKPSRGLLGVEEHGLMSRAFLEATVPTVLRSIFALHDLQRAPGQTGTLNRIKHKTCFSGNEMEEAYVDMKGHITPFPTSLALRFKPEGQ